MVLARRGMRRASRALGPLAAQRTPPPSPLPSWLEGLAVNGWREISGSSLSSAPTMSAPNGSGGVNTKQEGWCAWHATADGDILSIGQGGHGDYHGNEVNRIRLSDAAPAWAELVSPSASGDVTASSDYYSDGKPASVHGYYTCFCPPGLGKALRMPGGARSTDGAAIQHIQAFDLSGLAYEGSGTWGSSGPGGSSFTTGGVSWAMHPTTGDVYGWQANTRILKWTNSGGVGSWSTLVTFPDNPATQDTAAAIDPTRGSAGMMYLLGGGSSAFSRRVDLSDGTISTITLTGTDLSDTATYDAGFGLVYCQITDRYYACVPGAGGSSVYEITPTSGTSWACSLLSTTGGGSIPANDTALSQAPYQKFLYVADLGGGVGGVAFGPRWSANLWFLRLH